LGSRNNAANQFGALLFNNQLTVKTDAEPAMFQDTTESSQSIFSGKVRLAPSHEQITEEAAGIKTSTDTANFRRS